MKSDLAKIIKVKKNKIIALEMNISLRRSDLTRMNINLGQLIEIVRILNENIEILKKPGIVSRLGAMQESMEKLDETIIDIKKLEAKITKEQLKLGGVVESQNKEWSELREMEAEMEIPADVLPFRKSNVG